ncbi:elongation factor Ts [Actinoplanes campanulatus]|uniref:Elongation factor Ts n=1 Tax=Actinoplanes campanulatus TaxID=113559 RepID=A0A7W5ABV2_9ACTN|nr:MULTISPECIES: translation elongation factor Ts [Actinoplanes]MBB3093094.1 elongation factor Ts [Actinoplanes campanulatus]GGN01139.1 elongation factor Ts [Actinoplanes campanulatus]GID33810.1 elongation factor Ts [Actinoplanes campanulatus]GID44190.1 elongation factor Ts [Actinoplanes capillaceus]
MANYTAADVKKLRDLTGAGMMDCKKALEESEGDFDKAVEFLRIKGAKDVGKRAGRTAANGIVSHSGGALLELNCETDFVAKTPDFVALGDRLVKFGEDNKIADAAALLAATIEDGKTVADLVQDYAAKIGEKIVVNRFTIVDGTVAVYLHRKAQDLPPQVGVLVQYTGKSDEAADNDARAVGMQIAAMRPKFLTREEVPAEVVETERRVAEQTAREEGKPEQALPKIIEGRVNSFFKDFVLLEQASVVDNKKTVKQVVSESGIEVTRFVRYEVGQE